MVKSLFCSLMVFPIFPLFVRSFSCWNPTCSPNVMTFMVYSVNSTYAYIIIYNIYTRNAWPLPRFCSVEGPHSQSNVVATLHSIGKINKGIRKYWNPTPVKLYIQLATDKLYIHWRSSIRVWWWWWWWCVACRGCGVRAKPRHLPYL